MSAVAVGSCKLNRRAILFDMQTRELVRPSNSDRTGPGPVTAKYPPQLIKGTLADRSDRLDDLNIIIIIHRCSWARLCPYYGLCDTHVHSPIHPVARVLFKFIAIYNLHTPIDSAMNALSLPYRSICLPHWPTALGVDGPPPIPFRSVPVFPIDRRCSL